MRPGVTPVAPRLPCFTGDDRRIDQAGCNVPTDERGLADTDTLLVFGLDHLVSEPGEIEANPRVARSGRHMEQEADFERAVAESPEGRERSPVFVGLRRLTTPS